MSQENVERAREAYDALGLAVRNGDFDAFFREYVPPEAEWVPLEGGPDSYAVSFGQGPVKARLMEILDVMEEPQIEAEEIRPSGGGRLELGDRDDKARHRHQETEACDQ